ncbi:glycoside hydrolase family 30 protein [Gorillibacterium massiliense]|uniref:glycoside hydrolase family 30 protein n=1 Tax=Gorillibacterium massiliense TaxID=1280390 RepID=UPI0004BB85A9|nr:glycoside hydrolase family 30 protein [Gorillibacterium massiliense]
MKETIRVIQTVKDNGDRFTEKANLQWKSGASDQPVKLELNGEIRFQRIMGFGGAFTEAAATTLAKISPELRAEVIRNYYHPTEGLGYTLGRTHIHSCDFALGNYTYVAENDEKLETFDISHEKEYVIPMIKDAMREAGQPLTVLSSPWSPPAWMKTNGEMNNGGKLKPEFRAAWARYFAKYIRAMAAEGIDVWGVTVQNEPEATQTWDSCRYSAEEERDFVRDYLGPILAEEGYGDKAIVIVDHNRDLLPDRPERILSDPEAARYIWGTGIHWYVSEEFENLSKVHDAFPNKHLLFTEGCIEGGVQPGSWATGERYGRNIIGDLNNWLEGWLDWNLALNEFGGPNHVGNYCDAPVIADTVTGEVRYNSSFYYIGHFSKYIRPGAERIRCKQNSPLLQSTAFINEDGTIAVVVMNVQDAPVKFALTHGGLASETEVPAHSITTYLF